MLWKSAFRSLATVVLACLTIQEAIAADPRNQIGPGTGTLVIDSESEGDCGELQMNSDGTYEMAYCWQYGGVVPPDYGAVAECYEGVVEICTAVFDLCQTGGQSGQTMDVYVWDDNLGEPGAVLCLEPSVDPGVTAFWPSMSRHEIDLADGCCTSDTWWVGYWPDWPDEYCAFFFGGDTDGFGGCPLTKIAPGIGFSTGWQNVSVAWGPTQAISLGARVIPCESTPTIGTTWGAVKTLF